MEATVWHPPSAKRIAKLPAIVIAGNGSNQNILDWINANPRIPRQVKPLYQDFVIRYTRRYYTPGQDIMPRVYEYENCVHYDNTGTQLYASHAIDGRRIIIVHSNYADYNGINIKATVTATESIEEQYGEEWLRQEGAAVIYTVLATQAYIQWNPEVVSKDGKIIRLSIENQKRKKRRKSRGLS